MFLFNKSKKNEAPAPAPVPSKPASSPIKQPVNADDFFKDMGRKPKPKKVDFNIESPEITGLREAPLPRPKSTLSNLDTDAISTDGLRDKTLDVEEGLGNIKTVDVEEIDAEMDEVLPDKNANPVHYIPFEIPDEEPASSSDPLDPDSFFRDIDKRRKRKPKTTIEAPEVTGLRDAPEAAPESDISDIDTDALSTDALRDKTLPDNSFVHGDINVIDTDNIDTSSLRD